MPEDSEWKIDRNSSVGWDTETVDDVLDSFKDSLVFRGTSECIRFEVIRIRLKDAIDREIAKRLAKEVNEPLAKKALLLVKQWYLCDNEDTGLEMLDAAIEAVDKALEGDNDKTE